MSDSDEPRFVWSDVWIFLAIALVARDGPAELARIIAAADAVQHAIATREEINGAAGRLMRGGLVSQDGTRLGLTSAGRELDLATRTGGQTFSAREGALEAALGASSWSAGTSPTGALLGEVELYSAAEYADAIRAYRA